MLNFVQDLERTFNPPLKVPRLNTCTCKFIYKSITIHILDGSKNAHTLKCKVLSCSLCLFCVFLKLVMSPQLCAAQMVFALEGFVCPRAEQQFPALEALDGVLKSRSGNTWRATIMDKRPRLIRTGIELCY